MIKNILFDFGNIFVDLDFDPVHQQFKKYVGSDMPGFIQAHSVIFEQFETGHITQDRFIDYLSEQGFPSGEIINIWNSMLIGMPAHRLTFLTEIAHRYHLYLYSNINEAHETKLDELFRQQNGFSLEHFLTRYFLETYFSHHIGYRKPYKDGFVYIINDLTIKPEETLFIDDTERNLFGAEAVGMKTAWHDYNKDIVDEFEGYVRAAESI